MKRGQFSQKVHLQSSWSMATCSVDYKSIVFYVKNNFFNQLYKSNRFNLFFPLLLNNQMWTVIWFTFSALFTVLKTLLSKLDL